MACQIGREWYALHVSQYCYVCLVEGTHNNCVEAALRNEVLGRKAYYGSGSVWAAELAALSFSVLMTLVHCWKINPRRWLQEYLQACADNGGRAPSDLSAFLPWAMTPQRLRTLREPAPYLQTANTS